jgi:hypothetical protein
MLYRTYESSAHGRKQKALAPLHIVACILGGSAMSVEGHNQRRSSTFVLTCLCSMMMGMRERMRKRADMTHATASEICGGAARRTRTVGQRCTKQKSLRIQ